MSSITHLEVPVWRRAYGLGLTYLDEGHEIRSAFKQAGADCGIPYGERMGAFVLYAEKRLLEREAQPTVPEILERAGFAPHRTGGNLTAWQRLEGGRQILVTDEDGERCLEEGDETFLIGAYDAETGEEVTCQPYPVEELVDRIEAALGEAAPAVDPSPEP
ncbi:hypothetical protein LAZ40_02190 [Cereibacter sphaeroides]|uniref:hypothetical protein n=1 Tax=Cereibacter sphaeroides TaxID=1063 RepID=UPI001F37BE3A|nr:hypothetical protein [Cereibacter sphaeroides]MCE6957867.1 hypothetical protein [Cereibacter sphaeroides]MCE6971836.1 hypothetical protein [Cereibacter sphaeroides]